MNSSPDGIFFKDRNWRFSAPTAPSPRCWAVASPDELIGRKLRDGLVPVELAARIRAEEQELLRVGEPVLDVVREYRHGSEPGEWYSESKAPIAVRTRDRRASRIRAT